MSIEKERGLFIDWHFNKYYAKDADKEFLYEMFGGKNEFVSYEVQHSWVSWQASANREGYKLVPVEPTEEMWSELPRQLGRYMQMHNRYCPKTLKKYFDRFIGEPPEWLTKEVGNWDSDHAFATADLPVFIYKAMTGAVDEI